MLSKLIITLQAKEHLNYGISSLMQGALMEMIDREYAEKLHTPGLNPYTQHVELYEGEAHWIITALNEEAKREIIDVLSAEDINELHIKHKDMTLTIADKKAEHISYDELLENTYFGDCSPYINIDFVTPTSFKVNGKYQFYPTVSNIFKSLITKHDSVSVTTEFFSDELIEQIENGVEIIKYRLRSTFFYLEGVKIPSFVGNVTLRIRGPKQFVNLINMLISFGEYSGVGMKTGIGMGAIKKNKEEKRG